MSKSPFQIEYPQNNFIQSLKIMHQELMQLNMTSYQNITEEMLRQLGHMERTFIAVSHCIGKTPEWQKRSLEHERYDLKREEYWEIKESAQAEQFSARWSAVADILGTQNDIDAQINVLNAAISINEEIQSTLIEVWPEDRLPPKTIIFKDDNDWQEQIDRNKTIIEEYKWKLLATDDREQTQKVILNMINSSQDRELRLLLLCIGVQRLKVQAGYLTPFSMPLCFRPPEPRLFEMIDKDDNATVNRVSDINGFKSWVAAERRRRNGIIFGNGASVGNAIDRFVSAFEDTNDCCICILYVNKTNVDAVATIISEELHLKRASIKRMIKRTYPVVISCQSKENAVSLKKKISKMCVCC